MIEVEWQFDATDLDAVERWLLAQPQHGLLTFVARGEKVQVDTYFDSADWSVFRAGFALRVRQKPDGGEATLKAFGAGADGPSRRLEINESLPEGIEDPRAGSGEVAQRLTLLLGPRSLDALCRVTTRRRSFLVQQGGATLATLTLDDARLPDDALPPIQRVEIEEEQSGALARLEPFVQALCAACQLTPSSQSKFLSGLAAMGLTPQLAPDLGDPALVVDASAPDFALAALRRYFADLLAHEPGTRLGEDIEALHQMRVATRRLRAALGTFEAVLPSSLATLREELRWVAAALGTVRDLDVQIEALETMQRGASWDESNALGPLLAIARERRYAARAMLLEVLDSDRYARLVADTVAALRDIPPAEGAAPVRSFAAPVLRKRYRQFRREADALSPSSPAPEFHAVRVRAKRLRYTVEVFSVLADRPAAQLVDSLKGAQDLLGEHQDADVAIEWLRDIVREHGSSLPPATLLLMGELMERHRGRMVEHRRRWPRAHERLADRWKPLRVAVERAQPSRTSKREGVPTTALIPTVVETEVTIVRRAPGTGRPPSRFHWFRRGGR